MHQIQRRKRTTKAEVIVPGKQILSKIGILKKSYFKFSVKSSNFLFKNFKTEKFKLTFKG